MLRQSHKLSLAPLASLRLQQGLHMLQAPLAELSTYLVQQITINPFFDLSGLEEGESMEAGNAFSVIEMTHPSTPALYPFLIAQAKETFSEEHDLLIAQQIIGNLSDDGLFTQDPEELSWCIPASVEQIEAIRRRIQDFQPRGIASTSLQEYWLFLLRNTKYDLAYQIIYHHYTSLIACDFSSIAKKMHLPLEAIRHALKEALSSIPWSPVSGFSTRSVQPSLPDVYAEYQDEVWSIRISSRGLPVIKLNQDVTSLYARIPKEERKELSQQLVAAKWLIKNLKKREQTLLAVVQRALFYQKEYVLGQKRQPDFLSAKTLAKDLGCHESTIFRAIEGKALAVPIGIIPMKSLFPQKVCGATTTTKETVLNWIRQLIATETTPLSDAEISEKISAQGVACARRTVAKYRNQLHILPAHRRKV